MMPTEERALAEALRTALENFEVRQRENLRQLKVDLQGALWPGDRRIGPFSTNSAENMPDEVIAKQGD